MTKTYEVENNKHRRRTGNLQREKIISVSGRLFWQKSYLGTSINDIAKAANINKANLYYYFTNKSEILNEVATRAIDGLTGSIQPIANSESRPIEKLQSMVSAMAVWAIANVGLTGIAQIERKNLPPKLQRAYVTKRDQVEAMFRKVVGEVLTPGKGEMKNAKLTTLLILGLINSVTQWYKPGGELSPEQIASAVCVFVSEALNLPDPKQD